MHDWQEASTARTQYFPPQVGFTRPSRTLAISLTGDHCALRCAHCAGHYLNGMVGVEQADVDHMTSCLISGGFDEHGRLPVTSYLDRIASLHDGRVLNWHVGMIGEHDIRAIAPYADIISFDVVGDDDTIREVYGLDYTADDCLRTYEMLQRYVRVVPHLTLGLRGGAFSGEYRALRALQSAGLDTLVVLVLIPTRGTRYADCGPPLLSQVAEILCVARCTLPSTPIHLGCMRPGGHYRRQLDALAIWAGVNKIVNPAPSAVRLATDLGWEIEWGNECCVIQRP